MARNRGQPPAMSLQGILPTTSEGDWKLIFPQLGLEINTAQATPRLPSLGETLCRGPS